MAANSLNGIDVLIEQGFKDLKGKRVGLITNHTGLDRELVPTVDRLHQAEGVELKALFGPEHGIRGELDDTVPDSVDEKTGLPVTSLYGKHKKPTPEMLENLDALVFDIQDIGCRFYTYISTLALAMEACAEAGLTMFVLDRVNPIGGIAVEGPMADEKRLSFTAPHPIPVRHGMTVGELAAMFAEEKALKLDLQVIRCQNWRRDQMLNETGLYWVDPSPSMRNLQQALFYPGIGLLETTNLSVGRGTDTPFEVVGAPWMNGRQLAEAINETFSGELIAVPVRFTPRSREFKGEICEGAHLHLRDWRNFDSVAAGMKIACLIRDLFGEKWTMEKFINLLANEKVQSLLAQGASYEQMRAAFEPDLKAFCARRGSFLFYD